MVTTFRVMYVANSATSWWLVQRGPS